MQLRLPHLVRTALLAWAAAVICSSVAPERQGSNCSCNGHFVIIVADEDSGSTWLSQLLQNNPCAASFIPNNQLPDGKFRPHSIDELYKTIGRLRVKSKKEKKSAGFVLTPEDLAFFTHAIGNLRHSRAIRILTLTREPFFVGLSGLKKKRLRFATEHGKVRILFEKFIFELYHPFPFKANCNNPNQRGSADCPINASFTFECKPRDLKNAIGLEERKQTALKSTANKAAKIFKIGNIVHNLRYRDLLCSQYSLGPGSLPLDAAHFLGFDASCPTQTGLTAVKTSPPNPSKALRNFEAIARAFNGTSYSEALSRPYEDWPCEGSHALHINAPHLESPQPLSRTIMKSKVLTV